MCVGAAIPSPTRFSRGRSVPFCISRRNADDRATRFLRRKRERLARWSLLVGRKIKHLYGYDVLEGIKCRLMADSRYFDIRPPLVLAMYVLVDRNGLALTLPAIRSDVRSASRRRNKQHDAREEARAITIGISHR